MMRLCLRLDGAVEGDHAGLLLCERVRFRLAVAQAGTVVPHLFYLGEGEAACTFCGTSSPPIGGFMPRAVMTICNCTRGRPAWCNTGLPAVALGVQIRT